MEINIGEILAIISVGLALTYVLLMNKDKDVN